MDFADQAAVEMRSGVPHDPAMIGFIIEVRTMLGDTSRSAGTTRWIGIAATSGEMIARLPPGFPSVVDRGKHVLEQARRIGLSDGQVVRLRE